MGAPLWLYLSHMSLSRELVASTHGDHTVKVFEHHTGNLFHVFHGSYSFILSSALTISRDQVIQELHGLSNFILRIRILLQVVVWVVRYLLVPVLSHPLTSNAGEGLGHREKAVQKYCAVRIFHHFSRLPAFLGR
jgi:hypothetical protein